MPANAGAAAAGVIRDAIDVRRFPWIRPLVGAYARDYASLASLFAGNPADPVAWQETIVRVTRAPRDRAGLRSVLERQLQRRGAPQEAVQAAYRLTEPGTVAIVTGQQAGLFGGPLYTLLKAVTAIQLAGRVQSEYDVPAVPIFWVDGEDHDWNEVRTATVLDAELAVQSVALDPLEGAGVLPVASLVLDARIDAALEALRQRLAPSDFTADLIARLRASYEPGRGMATAFAAWLDQLLGPLGVVVFEAADAGAKPLASAVFQQELDRPGETSRLAREAGDLIARLGHDPQVQPGDGSLALFYLDGQGRRPITSHNGQFVIDGTTRSTQDLRQEAAEHPERFSPNVLLRPIVQDRLFPTVCYVAGPSELAYQAQLGGVYRAFEVEAPLLHSRATATLLDSAAVKFLDRSHLPFEALQTQDDTALNQLLAAELPASFERALGEIDRDVAQHLEAIRGVVLPIDPTLGGTVDTTLDRIRDNVKTLHGKVVQAAKRKDDTIRRQFTRTRALAFPGGGPQERVVNLAFFLNRYGPSLPGRLVEVLPLEADKHLLVTL